jgi:hypothetical protein
MPSKRAPLALAAFVIAALIGYFIWRSYPDTARATQSASDIRAVVKKDPRFIDVSIMEGPNATIFVVAPDKLSPELKATLERLVRSSSSGQKISLTYVVQSESSDH